MTPNCAFAGPCPDKAKHNDPGDIGYQAFFDWCKAKSRTHKQTQCKTCWRWVVWVRR